MQRTYFFRTLFLLLTTAALTFASTISIPGDGTAVGISEDPDVTPALRSLGQVFVVPTPTNEFVLSSFSFNLEFADTEIDYRGYVYEWDNGTMKAVGPALYTSSARTGADLPGFFGLNLNLDPLKQYIAFLTTQGVVNDQPSTLMVSTNSADPYGPGGAFVQLSTTSYGSTLSGDWTKVEWLSLDPTDLQFQATFVEGVPEPSTFVMAGIALAALAFTRRSNT